MFACCCSCTHGGRGWEQHPLPAVTSHTEPAAGGSAGAATLPTACRALHLHSSLLAPLLTPSSSFHSSLPPYPLPSSLSPSSLLRSVTVGMNHLEFCAQAAPERLFGSFSPARGTQGGFSCLALTFLRLGMPSSRVSQGCSSP